MKKKSFPHYKKILSATLLGITLQAATPAYAEVNYFEMDPEALLNLEISSASKKTEPLSRTAAAAYVITQEDILRAGVTTIPDALRMAPGVQVAQMDGNSWAISIRGFNSAIANKLLVMIDGRTVYNPIYAGTYWDMQDVNFSDIDRIEVIRGPGGTLWGANAVNGVINILTKNAHDTQGNTVTATVGSYENAMTSARHGGKFGDNGAYRIYAKYFNRDNTKTPAGSEANDDWRSGRGGFRADWDNYTLQGDVYRMHAHQNNTVFFPAPGVLQNTVEAQGGNILGRFKKNTSNGGLLTLQSYFDYARRNDPLLLDDRRYTMDFETQYNMPQRGRHEVIVGANYRYSMDNEEGSTAVASSLSPGENRENLLGAFIQDKIALVPDEWYFTAGSKIEHNAFSGLELEPSVRLEWMPNENQTYWTSVSRAVRTPSRLEKDVTLQLTPVFTLTSNEDFDSEELIAYEAGYRHLFSSKLSADIAVFYNDYDKIAGLTTTSATTAAYINTVKAESYGAEVSTKWTVNDNWSMAATYSYIDIQAHSPVFPGLNELPIEGSVPHHQASLRSTWNIADDWMLSSSAYYVSSLKTNDVDSYLRLDLNLGYKVSDNVSLNIVGQNLLDSKHREFGSPTAINAAEAERSFFGKVIWQF